MIDAIRALYASMPERLARARRDWKRPLTLSEKILVAHVHDWSTQAWERGKATLRLRVDRVAMQDATGQMALLQFMQAGKARVAVPSTVHCDHLIRAQTGASEDMRRAVTENNEVYEFLHSASKKYGIGFWKPGVGDHPPGGPRELRLPGRPHDRRRLPHPERGRPRHAGHRRRAASTAARSWPACRGRCSTRSSIGVHLTGKLSGWASPKDVITYLCGLLTVKGGTNKIVEYFGPGAESISATGKGTICNMGAELGATTSVFPFDERMAAYLEATDRRRHRAARRARTARTSSPTRRSSGAPRTSTTRSSRSTSPTLEPHIVGPHSPDRDRPISKLAAEVQGERLAGRDQGGAHRLVHQLLVRGHAAGRPHRHAGHQGRAQGADAVPDHARAPSASTRRSSATASWPPSSRWAARCSPTRAGPASASGSAPTSARTRPTPSSPRSTGTSRAGTTAAQATLSFLTSPEIVTALAFAGTLEFDPVHGTLTAPDGKAFRFTPPEGEELPARGLRARRGGLRGAGRGRRRRSRSSCGRTASGSSSSSRSRAGTGRTSTACRSWSRPRARRRPTTSRRPARGSGSAATSTRSATTCSSARSTPSPARPARA